VLAEFKKISADAVWIKPDRYWRWRVSRTSLVEVSAANLPF
jgi:hypothetical protein